MSSKKRIVIIILCVLVILSVFISGCVLASETSENQNPFVLMDYVSWGGAGAQISVFVDPITGVNYLMMREYNRAGICPRYNADGTLYVSEVT